VEKKTPSGIAYVIGLATFLNDSSTCSVADLIES